MNVFEMTKDDMKAVISDDIDTKIHVFTITNQLDFKDPRVMRTQLRALIEKSVEAWGFIPKDVSISGPNDDKEIDVKYSLMLPPDGKNTISGVKIYNEEEDKGY